MHNTYCIFNSNLLFFRSIIYEDFAAGSAVDLQQSPNKSQIYRK